MNFKKILAATTMLAVIATPAHAVKLDKANVIQLAGGVIAAAAATTVSPALELAAPQELLTGDYMFVLETNVSGGLFPGGQNIDVSVTLPAGVTFAAALTSNDVTSGTGGFLTNATLQTGGAMGDSAAVFRVSIPGAGSDNITFRVALQTTTCPTATTGNTGEHPGTLTVDAAFSDGTPVEGTGAATLPAGDLIVNTCSGFISGAITSDETDEDTFVALAAFTTLSDIDIAAVGTNNSPSVVGSAAYTITGTAHRAVTVAGTVVAPTYTPVAADATDVASIAQTLTFVDAASFGLAPGGGVVGAIGMDINDTGVAPAFATAAVLTGNTAVITTLAAGIAAFTTPAGAGNAHI